MTGSVAAWWPRERQRDWRELPTADVDWIVVWNVNHGGGGAAFSVRNRYWGDHPFEAHAVAPSLAWTWHADDVPVPATWEHVRGFGGIPSLISLTRRGVPLHSGIILVPPADAIDDLVALAVALDGACAAHGGAWCPALVGGHPRPRLGISYQQSVDPTAPRRTAEQLAIDDIIVVDPFAELGYATPVTPRVLVHGHRDGTERRARAGREALADVPVPPDLTALNAVGTAEPGKEPHPS